MLVPYRELVRRLRSEDRFPVLILLQPEYDESYVRWYKVDEMGSPLIHPDHDTREYWLIRLMQATRTLALVEHP